MRACPLCGATRADVLAELAANDVVSGNSTYRSDALSRLGISPEQRSPIVRCAVCGFVFAGWLPDGEFLRILYDDVIDARAAESESQSPAWVAHQLRLASSLLDRIGRDRERARILDYGCGYGTIVGALQGPNVACVGFEPAAGPREAVRRRGLTAHATLDEVDGLFDGIVLSDVLEHVPDPRTTLLECRDRLRDGGWVCVNVPDFGPGRLAQALGDVAAGRPFPRDLNPWEHLNYFSPATLARMVSESGFTVDPGAAGLDFGLRPDAGGTRRAGNTVKSLLRMAKFAFRPEAQTTTVLAQKR
jgi:SAM-dependent methyltransferase